MALLLNLCGFVPFFKNNKKSLDHVDTFFVLEVHVHKFINCGFFAYTRVHQSFRELFVSNI